MTRLIHIAIVAVCIGAGVGPAFAQVAPFSVKETARPAAAPPMPLPLDGSAASTPPPPPTPETTAPVPSQAAAAVPQAGPIDGIDGPRPFDVNGDGRSPSTTLPVDAPSYGRQPSTTTSPLAGSRQPTLGVPVDAVSAQERRGLTRLLERSGDTVRELRVALDNQSDWVDSVVERPIYPYRTLRLDGEIDSRSWSVFLSAAEAARGGTLSIAFTNSVLVLPEASALTVSLNGRTIAKTAIDSPDRTKVIALPLSPDLLRPGENAIRIDAEMRHRIDCSIAATFELWTRIDTRLTGLTFAGPPIPITTLADLGAVGVGTNGATRLRVIVGPPFNPTAAGRMLNAVQSAALRGRYVQPLVEVVDRTAGLAPTPGALNIAIGTADQLRGIVGNLPEGSAAGPTVDLVAAAIGPTVVLTGPTDRDVDVAIARFDAPGIALAPRSAIEATPPWLTPDSVRIDGGRTVTLREAGIDTTDFTGRRFYRAFQVTLPPDFYADSYGEARLLLDYAYSSDVEPGSSISVFVNGALATALPLTSSSGDTVENAPIPLGMQSFRPGINTIEIVAELHAESDDACLPGGTAPTRRRFALFSDSRLVFPDFARIGQLPNLAAFATNGFPYTSATQGPLPVAIEGPSADTLGAAGTLMARIAVSRGAAIETEVVEDTAPFTGNDLLIVGAIADIDNLSLEAVGVTGSIPSTWLQTAANRPGAPSGLDAYDEQLRRARALLRASEQQNGPLAQTDEDLTADPIDERNETARARERWLAEVEREGGVRSVLAAVWAGVRSAINFGRGEVAGGSFGAPLISDRASLLMAQAPAPADEDAAWTLVTAPTPALLSASMAALSAPETWTRIGGRISTFSLEEDRVSNVPAGRVTYVATVPLSFANLRLIAANWFSINNGVYALALLVAGSLLGLATYALVRPIGRR